MKSTPSTRDDLLNDASMVPKPQGCAGCLKVVPGSLDEYSYAVSCSHKDHFDAIAKSFLARGLHEVESGSFRRCFHSKNGQWVYKVPGNSIGYVDNYFEACAWKERANLRRSYMAGQSIGHRIARCRLHPSGVLVMERVSRPGRHFDGAVRLDSTLRGDPAWPAIEGIDSCQGGLDRQGIFRLYDYTHWVHIVDPIPASMMAL